MSLCLVLAAGQVGMHAGSTPQEPTVVSALDLCWNVERQKSAVTL